MNPLPIIEEQHPEGTQVEGFDMSYNSLQDLPQDYLRLFYITHVEYISLRNNSLSHIPVTIHKLKFLRHLYLEENNIELRNDDFINMTSLKIMYLCLNKNSRLQKRFFSGQTNLLKLSFIDNGLTDVDVDAFENLDKLDGLYLFYNKIKRFDINGKSLTLLTTLELSRNSLKEVSNLSFQ